MKSFTCRKAGRRWEVTVAPGVIATPGFIAPFRSFDKACEYIRYWLPRAQR